MPRIRLHLPAFRLPRSPFAPAPPGGRMVGLALIGTGVLLLAVASAPVLVGAQSAPTSFASFPRDPGVRGGSAAAGGVIAGATADEAAVFANSKEVFKEVDSVSGAIVDGSTGGSGLGPGFNLDSCAGCHAFPDVGGSSPFVNPQVAVAHRAGASNPEDLSAIVRIDGPVREVRFKSNQDATADGGVHDLFTIAGRSDAQGCTLAQPDFNAQLAAHNAIFRIPTPVFGGGLIEAIPDQTILDNASANAGRKAALGISGRVNREGNDGTITRFGWKAQNKSLQIFAGEAYNVEQGVTNQIFPDERDATPGCLFNATPEDHGGFTLNGTTLTSTPDDTVSFRLFMRFAAPPAREHPATAEKAAQIARGADNFRDVGCNMCHTPQMSTAKASSIDPAVSFSAALSDQDVHLFSDLLIHDMGPGLADGVAQGNASVSEFRSAPLWGLGQRIFFLHDGRTKDLLAAIRAHKSGAGTSAPSEANRVIENFNGLSPSDQQAILVFLRSL